MEKLLVIDHWPSTIFISDGITHIEMTNDRWPMINDQLSVPGLTA
jgi:hypothetical protein